MPQEQLETENEEKETDGAKTVDFASEISLEEMLKNIDEFRLPEAEAGVNATAGEVNAQPAEAEADIVDSATADEALAQETDVLTEQAADPAAGLWMVEELPEDAAEETMLPDATAEAAETAEAAAEETEEAEAEGAAAEAEETQTSAAAAWGWTAPETESVAAAEEVPDEAGLKTAEDQNVDTVLSQVFDESPAAEQQEEKEEIQKEESKGAEETMEMNERVVLDETSVITTGMVVTGDINTEGSVDVAGTVNGNIDAYGKLNITGYVNGNSKAAEIYAENAKINGQIVSEGAVKIESSTVIIGNISATSAAIAGAVKGDIDVKGPVILDASAIVMGNIKSKSVQINNGAVIEGMCSQCYADVNPTSFFDDYKPEVQTKSKSK